MFKEEVRFYGWSDNVHACAMHGRRLPELAVGTVRKILEDLWDEVRLLAGVVQNWLDPPGTIVDIEPNALWA